MVCYHPLKGYYSREIGKSGKRGITFDRGSSFSGVSIPIPCGQCVGCRLEKSRQWAMRCLHEKRLHKDSCFVTLTYDNEHLPAGGTLVKRDLQLFMKRLRNARGSGIRFYACGEYGDLNRRPHYHLLLFSVAFADRLFYKKTRSDYSLWTSRELDSYWPNGFAIIGDITFDSAAYVARYVMKKITGPAADKHYDVMTSDGEVIRRIPEFTVMSRRPGVGKGWFDRFGNETYQHDNCIINGKPVRPPRYYDGKFEATDADMMAAIKRKRKRKAALQYRENLIDRRLVREKVVIANLAQTKREL